MDLMAVSINAVVVAAIGGILAWLARGRFEAIDRRFEALDHRIHRLETRLDGRIDVSATRLEGRINESATRLDRRMDGFQASPDAMRSDLTQVALAVGVRPRAQDG